MDNLHVAVIHDIKNQLGELALLLERKADSAHETGIAFSAARRLTQLLLAQRQKMGTLQANIDSYCPSDLLDDLAFDHRAMFPALSIEVDDAHSPNFWFYDEALVRLALANAIHNACRYAAATVRMQAQEENGWLVFKVSDDGPGYPHEMLQHQAEREPLQVSSDGTGLGLYLAAEIARLHQNLERQGRVELGNHSGATFNLWIP